MRVLLDECVPSSVKDFLESRGHEVVTFVEAAGPPGAPNGEVHRVACERYELLLTTDRDFRSPSKYAATPGTGIVLIRVTPMTGKRVIRALETYLGAETLEAARGRKLILRADGHEWAS